MELKNEGLLLSKWISIAFLIVGIGIYRITYEPTFLGTVLVGAISGGLGGTVGEIYNRYLGKYDFNVIYFIDNVLWLILFCIPGLLVGSIVSGLFGESINNTIQATIIISVMFLISLPLTYRKLRAKQRARMMNIDGD